MRIVRVSVVSAILALLSACGGGGTGTLVPVSTNATTPASIHTARFTFQSIPTGSAPSVTVIDYKTAYQSSGGITLTSDGAVWWMTATPQIWFVRMQGSSLTTYPVNLGPLPQSEVGGPGLQLDTTRNGRVWGTIFANISVNGPSTLFYYEQGGTTGGGFDIGADAAQSTDMTTGPDGNLWIDVSAVASNPFYPDAASVDEIPENATDTTSNYFNAYTQQGAPVAITTGPDSNLWAGGVLQNGYGFYRINTAGQNVGTVTSTVSLSAMTHAVTGPDGNVWFTDAFDNVIGKITPSGVTTTYPLPGQNAGPNDITVGGDGALWFTESNAARLGRITTSGKINEYALPADAGGAAQIQGPGAPGCGPAQLWISANNGDVLQVIIQT